MYLCGNLKCVFHTLLYYYMVCISNYNVSQEVTLQPQVPITCTKLIHAETISV